MTVKEMLAGIPDGGLSAIKADVSILRIRPGENEIFGEGFNDFLKEVPLAYFSKLIRNCGDFETLFNNAAEFLAEHNQWCRARLYMWEKQLRTVAISYNLIHNTDKTQEETITEISRSTGDNTGSSETVGESTAAANSNMDNLHQISAANQTNFHNKNKDVVTEYDSSSANTNEHTKTKNEFSDEKESEIIHKIRAYGNIGVTTNQQMLKEERESALYDVVALMVDDFKKEFCIMIY